MLIALNLATRPFTDLRSAFRFMRIAMGVLAVVAVALGFVLYSIHRKAHEAHARIQKLDGEIANILREQQSYQAMMNRPENAWIQVKTEDLNQLFNQKAFSWTLVMEDLETVLPPGVKVTVIEPILAKDGHITLHVRVLGPRDKGIGLVQNLEHSRCFLQPRIVAESTDTGNDPNQKLGPVTASTPTDFDLLSEYNPDSAEEFTPVNHAPILAEPSAGLQVPGEASFGQSRPPNKSAASSIAHLQYSAGGMQ